MFTLSSMKIYQMVQITNIRRRESCSQGFISQKILVNIINNKFYPDPTKNSEHVSNISLMTVRYVFQYADFQETYLHSHLWGNVLYRILF
jgi:hypothetical protein